MLTIQARRAVAIGVTSVLMFACTRPPVVHFENQAAPLTVQRAALYPETIEYDRSHDRFLLSSMREGAIYQVDTAGQVSPLVSDPRLCSVLGIAVDAGNQRLWAVNSDLGVSAKPSAAGPKQLAGVGVYDLSTGKPQRYVDLSALAPGPHLLNGIAVDSNGDAFVSDSFAPIIYKVTANGEASIFLQDQRFAGTAINLNGLLVHPDGYLLVIKKSDGALYKVPLKRPAEFSRVAVARAFIGGDGITLLAKQALVVIANRTPEHSANAAYSLVSQDDWASAQVTAVQELGDVYPTTAALRNDTLYVVHSKLNQLIAAPPEQKAALREQATIRAIGRISN